MAEHGIRGTEGWLSLCFHGRYFFEIILYKGTPNTPLLFKIVIRLHQVNVKGELTWNEIYISGIIIIESSIAFLLEGNKLAGIMRGVNPLQFVNLWQGVVEIPRRVEPWLKSWWEKYRPWWRQLIDLGKKKRGGGPFGPPHQLQQKLCSNFYSMQGLRGRIKYTLWSYPD